MKNTILQKILDMKPDATVKDLANALKVYRFQKHKPEILFYIDGQAVTVKNWEYRLNKAA